MLPPEAVQIIVDLALHAILIGCMAGFFCSRLLDKGIDFVLYLIERRDRINAARNRDHSKVPSIHG
ncbi:hypothetical protein [Variovorax sp. 160MFSha2.1]|uniref:hypothetical protein n=1 Tax=Variovorax sp. 160MFSha2.1 TaxID=3158367 RepID=UPI003AAB7E56